MTRDAYLEAAPHVWIPLAELEFSYARSSGPGGQNVNKVNSKALLRWNLLQSPSLTEEQRALLLVKLENKINQEGELLLSSDSFRDQIRNREDCIERFRGLVTAALVKPKKRKKTKQSFSSRKRNEASKKKHSEKKKMRSSSF